MSRLRFAILLAASSLGVLLVAASASSSPSRPPEVHIVGDEMLSEQWATRQRFYVGDVLDFKGSNNFVLLVRQGDYERCSAASPLVMCFSNGGDTHTLLFTLDGPGLFYFISGVPARCEAGERMVVRVADPLDSGAAPTPAPAPGPEPNATVSTPRRRPLTLAQMQMVAGALGFAAGFVTTFLIVALFICCCP